jgi:RNA polymerase sigma-70 factor (ECF subfamily)
MSQLSPEGFARRFTDCSRMLWCIAAAVTRDPGLAEDVLQEAALIALRKLGTFDARTDFAAWMCRIVRYTALNHARRRKARGLPVDPAMFSETPSPPPPHAAPASPRGELFPDQQSFDDRVIGALGRLEETARACLLLRVVLDLPYQDIARSLGIPQGTAMSHVHRARRAMGSHLSGSTSEAPR